jgi:multiple sugar transport system ATP-binding protein
MGDRVLVMEAGAVMGVGTPAGLYENPPNRFVATFLGRPPINLFRGRLERLGGGWQVQPFGWPIAPVDPSTLTRLSGVEHEFAIRPEHVHVTGGGTNSRWRVMGREYLGDRTYCTISDGLLTLTALAASPGTLENGHGAGVSIQAERILLFDAGDGRRLL